MPWSIATLDLPPRAGPSCAGGFSSPCAADTSTASACCALASASSSFFFASAALAWSTLMSRSTPIPVSLWALPALDSREESTLGGAAFWATTRPRPPAPDRACMRECDLFMIYVCGCMGEWLGECVSPLFLAFSLTYTRALPVSLSYSLCARLW